MYISYLGIILNKLLVCLSYPQALPLATFLLAFATFILIIFSYLNSRLLRILNAESIHFPKIRGAIKTLIDRINSINEIVVTLLPFENSLNQESSENPLYKDNQEENLLISDFIQFHTFSIKRKKEICSNIKQLDILFEDYKKINNGLVKTIKEIIDKELNNNDVKYNSNISNCTNCYNEYFVKFIARSWSREIFDINKTSWNQLLETEINKSSISEVGEIYTLVTKNGTTQTLCHSKLEKDIKKLKEIFERLTTEFNQLNEFKIYKQKIQENRENFQKHYKILKDLLEKMKFYVKFKGKCEFLGGHKELKNIITKDGINCGTDNFLVTIKNFFKKYVIKNKLNQKI